MLVRPIHAFNSTLPDIPAGVVLAPSDILDAGNPHVRARPDLFVEVTATFGVVEQATASPGEKRTTRRTS